MTHSMESLQVKEVGLKTPETGLKDLDAKAAAYTAETGSYMYMCPEVKLPLESRKKLHLHVAMLTWYLVGSVHADQHTMKQKWEFVREMSHKHR